MPVRARFVAAAVALALVFGGSAGARRPVEPRAAMPCEVRLEHGYLVEWPRGGTWAVLRTSVVHMVRADALLARGIDWLHQPVAPAPIMLPQALSASNLVSSSRRGSMTTVIHTLGEGDATLRYQFDRRGRLTRADLDLVADASTYVFAYEYRCSATVVLPQEGEIPRPLPYVETNPGGD